MNRALKVRVDRVAPEGDGIGKAEGSDKVVFVPHSVPGDLLLAETFEEKPRYLRARPLEILEPAPSRIEPDCPYHFRPGRTEYCGGCDWQMAAYPEQLKLKRAIVADALRRIGRLDAPVLEAILSPSPWRYRNKAQVPFRAAPGPGGIAAGFFVPGTHRVVEIEDCLVQPELSVAILRSVRALSARLGWRAYDEARDRGWLRHLLIRTNSRGEAGVVFVTRTDAFPEQGEALSELRRLHPEVVSIWQNVQEERTSVILGPRWSKLWGSDRLAETVGGLTLEVSPGSFLQVNTPAAEALYREVEGQLFESGFQPRLLIDAYCGVGAIALWLARGAARVVGVEESSRAVEDARSNAHRLGLGNASFVRGRAEHALPRLRLEDGRPWAAVLDPPRAGCAPAVLKWLAGRRFERVIYASCDPATFARDARILADSGYALDKVRPVDLFPQTSHVELAARFALRQHP